MKRYATIQTPNGYQIAAAHFVEDGIQCMTVLGNDFYETHGEAQKVVLRILAGRSNTQGA